MPMIVRLYCILLATSKKSTVSDKSANDHRHVYVTPSTVIGPVRRFRTRNLRPALGHKLYVVAKLDYRICCGQTP